LLKGYWANYSLETGDMGLIFSFMEDNTVQFILPRNAPNGVMYAEYRVDWSESPYNITFIFDDGNKFELEITFIDEDRFSIVANIEDKVTEEILASTGIHEYVVAERISEENYQYALLRQKYPSESDIRNVLSEAIQNDDIKKLDELINAGVDPNTVLVNGYTILAQAVWTNSPKVVSYLFDNGADPYLEGEYGTKSAYEMAVSNQYHQFINLFSN